MRPRRGCEPCRQRHRKCIIQPGSSLCNGCKENDRECRFEPRFKFHNSLKAAKITHSEEQLWATLPASISFATPERIPSDGDRDHASAAGDIGGGVAVTYSKDASVVQPAGQVQRLQDLDAAPSASAGSQRLSSHSIASPYAGSVEIPESLVADHVTIKEGSSTGPSPGASQHPTVPSRQQPEPPFPFAPATASNVASIPFILSDFPSTPNHVSPAPTQFASPRPDLNNISGGSPSSILNKRQAFLFRIYVQKLAPVADACDDARRFTTVVPQLALHEPMILNAILALACRYHSLGNNSKFDLEATYYHNRCIELLIDAFAQPEETYNSTLLTAVVIARLYEEYDPDNDSHHHHLVGTRNLLNHNAVARFVTEGGLAEAASWLHLRQAIYVFLVRRKPVDVSLRSFELSTSFRKSDDGAYSNRMVYLFARVLKLFFPGEGDQTDGVSQSPGCDSQSPIDGWQGVEQEISVWLEGRPLSFLPVYYESADVANGKAFPIVWMIASAPVVGMQHYYAARIIFCLQECHNINPNAGYMAAKIRRDNERAIAAHLGAMMGLAVSNSQTENAFFLPAHMLFLCGYCIRSPLEREQTIEYLYQVHRLLQWKVEALVNSLRDQWSELDGLERS